VYFKLLEELSLFSREVTLILFYFSLYLSPANPRLAECWHEIEGNKKRFMILIHKPLIII
jgi:hypothetical protein